MHNVYRMQEDGTEVCSLYCIDKEESFVQTCIEPSTRILKKQRSDMLKADSSIATIKVIDLFGTSFSLNHEDACLAQHEVG